MLGHPSRLLEAGIAAFALALLVAAAYADVLFLGKTCQTAPIVPGIAGRDGPVARDGRGHLPRTRVLDPGASGWQYEPWAYQIHDAYARGEIPLWNPHAAFGAPFAANLLAGAAVPTRVPLLVAPGPVLADAILLARLVLAGLFAFLLLRRLSLGATAALAGGAAFGLCGYFTLHANMTHLDVEIYLPALFLAADLAARSPGTGAVALLAGATGAAALGGNPESLAVSLLAAAAFGAARARLRPSGIARIAIGFATGLLLAAPILVPGIEYVSRAEHVHDAAVGLVMQSKKSLVMALVPDFFGPTHRMWTAGNPRFRWIALGAVPWGLAIGGLAASKRRLGLAAFFGGLVLVSTLKVLGVEPVQSIGTWPLLEVVLFPKHLQPAIALGIAALAAMAIDRIFREDRGRVAAAGGLVVVTAVIVTAVLRFEKEARAAGEFERLLRASGIQVALAAAAAAAAVACRPRVAARVLLLGVAATVFAGVPGHRPDRVDPLAAEPSYLAALRAESEPFRVAGYDGVLHPNWAGVFGVDDLRSLDALNVRTSLAWIRERVEPLAADRFTGRESISPDLLSGAIDEANVRFLLSHDPIEDQATRLLARVLEAGPTGAGARPALRVTPGRPLSGAIDLPPGRPARLDAALATEDGKGSLAIAASAEGGGEAIAAETAPGDARVEVDLSALAGRRIRLAVSSRDGDVLLAGVDPAVFGRRLAPVAIDGPFKLYRNPDALPRAYVVTRAIPAPPGAEFDPRNEVAIEGLSSPRVAREDSAGLRPACVAAAESGRVIVRVEGLGPGWLVLLDAPFPGWTARVDGRDTPIRVANGAFRAVEIGAAASLVDFRYDPPSFRAGLALAAVGLFALVVFSLLGKRPS